MYKACFIKFRLLFIENLFKLSYLILNINTDLIKKLTRTKKKYLLSVVFSFFLSKINRLLILFNNTQLKTMNKLIYVSSSQNFYVTMFKQYFSINAHL